MIEYRRIAVVVVAFLLLALTSADAQTLGVFRWQLQPFCNALSLSVTEVGAVYRLEGFDEQCGGTRAPVTGLAVPNADGTIHFGLTLVTSPTGASVHLDVVLNPGSISGTWQDDSGNAGNFILNPGATSGPPRGAPTLLIPDGAITTAKLAPGAVDSSRVLDGSLAAADINATQIQRRVTGACAGGTFAQSVNQDGTVNCATPIGGGDITAVIAGAGLTGGATSGDAALAVNLAGPGAATTVARSDHTHAIAGPASVAVGPSALTANTTGFNNTAAGSQALAVNTTGNGNTAIGQGTLRMNTTGIRNTAVGVQSLRSNTTANFNSAFGVTALFSNTTGALNSAFGDSALYSNTTGGLNTAMGLAALGANTTGSWNTALGYAALVDNQTGLYNTGIGGGALVSNTGSGNTAVGFGALNDNTTADNNTAVGTEALRFNTAAYHVAVGFHALRSNTTGEANTAVGHAALETNTIGTANTAVGRFALAFSTTSSSNTAVGYYALVRNTEGGSNAALGSEALANNTTGNHNVAVGELSLSTNQTGGQNTGIGAGALQDTVGDRNIAVGFRAGSSNTGGSDNIYVGHPGQAESNAIRIGTEQTATYVAGIFSRTSSAGIPVLVNAAGQLGTAMSSGRFKEDVETLGAQQTIQRLRPVRFFYTPQYDDGSHLVQYGLIAEEVAEIAPELLVRDNQGRPQTVRYHLLAPMLVAEVQRLEKERATQAAEIAELRATLAALAAEIKKQD